MDALNVAAMIADSAEGRRCRVDVGTMSRTIAVTTTTSASIGGTMDHAGLADATWGTAQWTASARRSPPAASQRTTARQPLAVITEDMAEMNGVNAPGVKYRAKKKGLGIGINSVASDLNGIAVTEGPLLGAATRTAARALPTGPAEGRAGDTTLIGTPLSPLIRCLSVVVVGAFKF